LGWNCDRDAVVAVLVDDPDHRQVHLVEFVARLVLELVAERALPLGAGDGVEAPVLQALQAFVAHGGLDLVEIDDRLGVDLSERVLRC
jgi:hypothetical protein